MQLEAGVQRYGLWVFGYSGTNDKLDISYVRVRKTEFFHEVRKLLHGSGGFDPHPHRSRKAGIKLLHIIAFVLQSRLHYLAGGGLQHRQRLLASVQITSYNFHLGLLRSELC